MHQPHIHEYKTQEVEDVKRLFYEYPVVGLVNMENLSAKTLQKMKKALRDKMIFKITRKRFIEIAMESMKEKQNIMQVKERLEGIPALIFTKEEPFTLYKLLEKSKTPAPAKPGQKSPLDITIPAGPTPFTPGPMIGELGHLGIKTEVKEGKINVREEKLLVREGEVITAKVAELLAKLGIEPMKLGINLVLAYHRGEILTKSVLFIDEEKYINDIKTAHVQAFALAQHLGIITPDTIKPLVVKTFRAAKFIAEKCDVLTPETIGKKLAEAESAAEILQQRVPEHPAPQTPQPVAEQQKQTVPQPSPKQPQQAPQQSTTHPAPEASFPAGRQQREVVIESKQLIQQSDIEKAEKFLKDLTEKAVKIGDGKKVEPRIQPQQDISKLIDQLKDKKSRGEL